VKHISNHDHIDRSGATGRARIRAETGRAALSAKQRAGLQYAALPYRMADGLEILLITSRETGRWVLPKGWPMKGKEGYATAAREAEEEAGVRGRIGKMPIGCYGYGKRLPDGVLLDFTVQVYPLEVEKHMDRWPEQGQRTIAWFKPEDAADLVEEDELASLIDSFAAHVAV
jgi:8-oxo-dGTP pyrophosphatase MutT (NUDIX family)